MNSREYWLKRAAREDAELYKRVEDVEAELKEAYEEALSDVLETMESYAARHGMSYKGLLVDATKINRKKFDKWVKENAKRVMETGGTGKNTAARFFPVYDVSKVDRSLVMLMEISKRLTELGDFEHEKLTDLLSSIYKDTLTRDKFDLFVQERIMSPIYKLDEDRINQVLTYPWSGDDYSSNIWANLSALRDTLQREFVQAAVKGSDIRKVAKIISDKFDASYKNSMRLARTESAYIANKASLDVYSDLKLERYEFLATLDKRTSTPCRSLDGKVFNTKDAIVGTNYPPMHPHCRSTTIPYFDDDEEITGQRIARDENNRNIYLDGNITYNEYVKLFQ